MCSCDVMGGGGGGGGGGGDWRYLVCPCIRSTARHGASFLKGKRRDGLGGSYIRGRYGMATLLLG